MQRTLHRLSAIFGFGMFLVAVWVLQNELRNHPLGEITAAVRAVPVERLGLALLFTVICYGFMTAYDFLALKCIRRELPFQSVMVNSFVCHAVSVNVGCSSVTGGTIRCHYYLRKGFHPSEVLKVILLCSLTYWLGFFALGALLFLFFPHPSADHRFIGASFNPVGIACLVLIIAYLLYGFFRTKPFRLGRWMVPVMPMRMTILQIIVSVSEWIIGTAVLYVLLPHIPEFSYFHLLGYYFIAQATGLLSQVPSGLGVFESIVLTLAPPEFDKSAVVAALLLYRVIFSLLPLMAGGILLLIREFRFHRRKLLPS